MKAKGLFLALSFLITAVLVAQDFQGIATYKTDRKIDIKLDSTKMDDDMQQRMKEVMRKQFQKEFTLTFNRFESVYKEEQSLKSPAGGSSGWNLQVRVVGGGGGADILYKNVKEERFSEKTDLMGKIFLVQDKLEKQDWKLENETKKIGNYTCYKATFTEEVEERSFGNEEGEMKETTKMVEKVTTAWYSPEIPVNNGPDDYWGLPGLILEVNDGKRLMLCSKIVLNPKDKVGIIEPSKGKKVDQAEFDGIQDKKAKEMMERMQNNRSDDGKSIKIRIGG